ncbi:MAG: MerR family DNA-binding protein, partial [Terracoccus sp.]
EVAATVGVAAQTIRCCARKGLLPPPQRTANGYRTYDEQTLNRLRFIRHGQGAGLTLLEITVIIDLRSTGASPCDHVTELLSTKLHDIRARQRELTALAAKLQRPASRGRRLDPAVAIQN